MRAGFREIWEGSVPIQNNWDTGFSSGMGDAGVAPITILQNYVHMDPPATPDPKLYEPYMNNLVAAAISYMNSYQTSMTPLQNSDILGADIRSYQNYWRMQFQGKGMTTWDATSAAYNQIFGSFSIYQQLMTFLDNQFALVSQGMANAASAQLSTYYAQVDTAQLNFYTSRVVPLSGGLSTDNQSFLQDIFLFRAPGAVSCDELNQALSLLVSQLNETDMATVMGFAPQMILGISLGSSVLTAPPPPPNSSGGQGVDNPFQDAATITTQYLTMKAQLGSFALPAMDDEFNQFIEIVKEGTMNFNGTDILILQYMMTSVENCVSAAFTVAASTAATIASSLNQSVATIENAVNSASASNPIAPTTAAQQQALIPAADSYVATNWNPVLPVLGAAALVWYLFRGKI